MAYSQDYRKMILDKLAAGYSYRKIASEHQMSVTTIQRWKKDPSRKKRKHTPRKIDMDKLREDILMYPDDYQFERARRFGCTQKSICVALKRLKTAQEINVG